MKAALIQMRSGVDKARNISRARDLVEQAASRRAELICLPEVFVCRGLRPFARIVREVAEPVPGPTTKLFCELAAKRKCAILLGSLYETSRVSGKTYNTSVLISSAGKVLAKYRKQNLFSARLGATSVDETKVFKPGTQTRTATVRGLRFGLTVCYDIRFPRLYRRYADKGCDVFFVPSNFTEKTGRAHWEVLLRARAVENLSYVLAPNQIGAAGKGVKAYGNSLIVDPWGRVVARASGNKEEIITAKLSKQEIRAARKSLPGFAR